MNCKPSVHETVIKLEPLSNDEDNEADTQADDSAPSGYSIKQEEREQPSLSGSETVLLYDEHEIKDEMVIGPELLQTNPDKDATHVQTNKMKYSCRVCNKHFRYRTALQRHSWLHTDEEPFSCIVCGKTFVRQEALRRHIDMSLYYYVFSSKQY